MIGVEHYRDADAVQRLVDDALLALALPASFIRPGDRVVLKPNWIKEHDERHPAPGNWEHVITNPTVIAAVFNASRGLRPCVALLAYGEGVTRR